MNKIISLLAVSALLLGTATSCKKKGCTDPSAVNYSTEAKKDDGSCKFIPKITVNGNNPETISVGSVYADPGATATNVDGSAATLTTTSNLDANNTGTYTITYTASNENGTATATRTVNVVIGLDNWLVDWGVSSDCGTTFPLDALPLITEGTNANALVIDNMFNTVGGTAYATINGNNITLPTQTIDFTFAQVTFSGVGTMNSQGTEFTINYTYDNTTPILGGSGTCVATYTKQ